MVENKECTWDPSKHEGQQCPTHKDGKGFAIKDSDLDATGKRTDGKTWSEYFDGDKKYSNNTIKNGEEWLVSGKDYNTIMKELDKIGERYGITDNYEFAELKYFIEDNKDKIEDEEWKNQTKQKIEKNKKREQLENKIDILSKRKVPEMTDKQKERLADIYEKLEEYKDIELNNFFYFNSYSKGNVDKYLDNLEQKTK